MRALALGAKLLLQVALFFDANKNGHDGWFADSKLKKGLVYR